MWSQCFFTYRHGTPNLGLCNPMHRITFVCLYRGAAHGEEGEDDDSDEVSRWNMRKCSAAGLDVLSTVFQEEMLPIVTPIVQQRLQVHCPLPGCMFPFHDAMLSAMNPAMWLSSRKECFPLYTPIVQLIMYTHQVTLLLNESGPGHSHGSIGT